MKCNECGFQNSDDSVFCEECGNSISEDNLSAPPVLFAEPLAGNTNQVQDSSQNTRLRYFENEPCTIISYASSAAHIGFVKDQQEDRVLVKTKGFDVHDVSVYITAVADGMGGYEGGEICAEIGVAEFALTVYEALPAAESQSTPRTDFILDLEKALGQVVPKAISKANRRVRGYLACTGQIGGGAIIVASVILVDHRYGRVKVFGYSQGDARAMLCTSNGEYKLLTTDHAINGKPTRFLGVKDSIGPGAFNEEFWFSEIDFRSLTVLLYSDGLWQMLSEDEINNIVQYSTSAGQTARGLLKAALLVEIPAGAREAAADERVTVGDDNISIIAVNFSRDSEGEIR